MITAAYSGSAYNRGRRSHSLLLLGARRLGLDPAFAGLGFLKLGLDPAYPYPFWEKGRERGLSRIGYE